MKIVLWIANEPNQKALANKINAVYPITAIVTESRKIKRKLTLAIIAQKIVEKIFIPSIGKAWWNMLKNYDERYLHYPDTDILDVENINSKAVYNFTAKHKPDLILVSGTRLVKEKMFRISPNLGILNLHTGLSPYIKGGPNCTNWCLANKDFHLIGNTIMWIDKGIDTGNLLTTEFTAINGSEDLLELHQKVMNHAHCLYIKAIKFLATGQKQNITQSDIAEGKTFYNKEWTLRQKFRLIRNLPQLKKELDNGNVAAKQKDVVTVGLDSLL